MPFTDLDQANEDARYRIYTYSRALNGTAENDPASLFAIAWEQRQTAICSLLQEGDTTAYQLGLRRAGLAWMHLLGLADGGMPVSPRMLMGSTWSCLASVAAANDVVLGRELAARFPTTCDDDREYADEYFPLALLSRALAVSAAGELTPWCDQWEAALEGDVSADLAAWRALANADAPAFAEAFESMVADRLEQMTAYRSSSSGVKTIAATEGGLYIDGLAMLQVARSLKLELPKPQPMCPAVALVPRPTTALPKQDWQQID